MSAGAGSSPVDLGLIAAAVAVAALVLIVATGLMRKREPDDTPDLANLFGRRLIDGWETIAGASTAISVAAILHGAVRFELGIAGALSVATPAALLALLCVAACHLALAARRGVELLVYTAEVALVGAYLLGRETFGSLRGLDAVVLVLFAFADLAISEALEQRRLPRFARPTFYAALAMPALSLVLALAHDAWDDVSLTLLFSAASFYGVVCHQKRWKGPGYVAALLYTGFLWLIWSQNGWRFAEHPQLYLVPVGILAILFAEVNHAALGREAVQVLRALGSGLIYVSTAFPMWQFQSFAAWLMLLLLSLAGILLGIGMRVLAFLGLGLISFLFDLVYPLGRLGVEHAIARWGIMLGLGVLLVLFAALTEKRQVVARLRGYYEEVRRWD